MLVIDAIRIAIRHGIRALAVWLDKISRGSLTPDMVTLVGVGMHLPVAVLIANGLFMWGAVLLVVFGLFDVLDGELARYQKRASAHGMLLDAATDRIKEVLIYSGVAYYLALSDMSQWTFLAVVACGASITVSYVKAKGEAALASQQQSSDHHALNHRFKDGIAPFEIRMTIIVLGLLFNQLLLATAVVAVLASLTVAGRLRTVTKALS